METGLGVIMLIVGLAAMGCLYTEANEDRSDNTHYLENRLCLIWVPFVGIMGLISILIGFALIFKWFY